MQRVTAMADYYAVIVGLPDLLPPIGVFQVWLQLVNIWCCEHKVPEVVDLVCVHLHG